MEEFENRTIDLETLERLKKNMESMRSDTEKQQQEAAAAVRAQKQEKQTRDELEKLRSGSKAYPKYLENARATSSAAFWRKLVRAWMCMCWLICWT